MLLVACASEDISKGRDVFGRIHVMSFNVGDVLALELSTTLCDWTPYCCQLFTASWFDLHKLSLVYSGLEPVTTSSSTADTLLRLSVAVLR